MRRALPLALALVLLPGCGAGLQGLVAAKHYREAICAAHDGSDADRAAVLDALDADADVHVHVFVAPPEDLRPALGDATEAVSARARFAQVRAQSNVLPIDALGLDAAFETANDELGALPVAWETLAWATEEKLPPKRNVETYMTGENVLKAGAAVLTGGLSLLFGGFSPGVAAVEAPLQEYERMAPHASALRRDMLGGGCGDVALAGMAGGARAGKRCTWFFVVDHVSRMPVSLEIRKRYVALRKGGDLSDSTERGARGRCTLERASRIPLGTPQALEQASKKAFGERMRRLAELAEAP